MGREAVACGCGGVGWDSAGVEIVVQELDNMRIVSNILAIMFVLSALMVLGFWRMHVAENPKSHFATYNELATSGLIDKGWLPPYLPQSITDISEAHNIDTNDVWATFKFDKQDVSNIEKACKQLVKSPEGAKYVCPPFEKQTTVIILKSNGVGSLDTEQNDF